MEKRFYYCRSHVYGWAVYDRNTNTPAWDACARYLPPVRKDENGTVTVDPCCDSEYAAMRLCSKLSIAFRKANRATDIRQMVAREWAEYWDGEEYDSDSILTEAKMADIVQMAEAMVADTDMPLVEAVQDAIAIVSLA